MNISPITYTFTADVIGADRATITGLDFSDVCASLDRIRAEHSDEIGWTEYTAADGTVTAATGYGLWVWRPADDEWEDDMPDTCLNRVDGHWYVITYGRAPYQIHAEDCETCIDGGQ